MSRRIYYQQCRLVKKLPEGEMCQISWIPAKFAIQGKCLKLRQDNVWDNGWIVEEVWSSKVADDDMTNSHDAIKQHRKATGDSLPK